MELDPERKAIADRMIEDDERAAAFYEREARRLRASAAARRKVWQLPPSPPRPNTPLESELMAVGDYMQSSLSRLADYVHEQRGVPYEVGMAAAEGRTAVEQWTEARRKS